MLSLSSPLPSPLILNPHRPIVTSFIHHSHSLVTLILDILNDRLGLARGTLTSLHRLDAISGDQVRFIKAPPQPKDDKRIALGEHTDFGSVTVLFNRIGGLQVRLPKDMQPEIGSLHLNDSLQEQYGKNGDPQSCQWAYVRPLPGHAIVNLGDALVKFTAGILRSNVHRVVPPPGEQANLTRYSLVYFARPEDDVILKPLRGCAMIDKALELKGEEAGEDNGITSKEWILRRALGRRGVGSWEKSTGTESARN
jgi:isopenicillin N synthase-like dioxygenase